MVRLKEMDITIEGMHCASCIVLVDKTFEKIDGIEEAEAILANNKLHLLVNPKKISFDQIIETVNKLGFTLYFDKITLHVKGMHCASCTLNVENFLMKLDGIFDVKADLTNEKVNIRYDKQKIFLEDMENVINKLGFEVVGIDGQISIDEEDSFKKDLNLKLVRIIVGLVFAVILFIVMYFGLTIYNLTVGQFSLLIAIIPFIFVSYPILKAGFKGLSNKNLNMDVMYTMGILVAFISSVLGTFGIILDSSFMFYETALMLPSFLTIGRYLEAKAKNKTSKSIKKLISLQPTTAIKVVGNCYEEILISQIKIGDILLVRPGDQIPVDGVVVEGNSYIDESMINGEPIPNSKYISCDVFAGTLNHEGILKIKAEKIGKDTVLNKIIGLVEKAQASKLPAQRIADTIVAYFIPVILTISIVVFALWYFVVSAPLLFSLTTLISILVVACPCALGLATPTAITVGIGRASEFGILIKNAESLENACKTDIVAFDKTGTITEGKPKVDDIYGYGLSVDEFLQLLGSLERNSNHPIAKAIIEKCEYYQIEFLDVKDFEIIPGKGIKGIINGEIIQAGNLSLFRGMFLPDEVLELYDKLTKESKTVILLTNEVDVIGILSLSDKIKEGAVNTIKCLHDMDIKTILITGDNEETANYVAQQLGIDYIESNTLPKDKINIVENLQKEYNVLFAGDGINDAPALTKADIGVAMGNGADIAMESGDIVVIEGDLENVVASIEFSKKVMTRIKQNLFWAFAYNIILIPFAAGILYPVFGIIFMPEWSALAMALSSVTVISLSLMLKNYIPSIKSNKN